MKDLRLGRAVDAEAEDAEFNPGTPDNVEDDSMTRDAQRAGVRHTLAGGNVHVAHRLRAESADTELESQEARSR